MFDFAHFFNGLIGLIKTILNLYTIVILIRVVASWLGADPYNPIIQFIARMTDPVFDAVRRRLPRALWSTGLDFSPLIVLLLVQIVILFLEALRIV